MLLVDQTTKCAGQHWSYGIPRPAASVTTYSQGWPLAAPAAACTSQQRRRFGVRGERGTDHRRATWSLCLAATTSRSASDHWNRRATPATLLSRSNKTSATQQWHPKRTPPPLPRRPPCLPAPPNRPPPSPLLLARRPKPRTSRRRKISAMRRICRRLLWGCGTTTSTRRRSG